MLKRILWVEVCVAKPDNFSSPPESHTVKGENRLPQVLLQPRHRHHGTCTYIINSAILISKMVQNR